MPYDDWTGAYASDMHDAGWWDRSSWDDQDELDDLSSLLDYVGQEH